jgi:hypothetical protein
MLSSTLHVLLCDAQSYFCRYLVHGCHVMYMCLAIVYFCCTGVRGSVQKRDLYLAVVFFLFHKIGIDYLILNPKFGFAITLL